MWVSEIWSWKPPGLKMVQQAVGWGGWRGAGGTNLRDSQEAREEEFI